MGKIDEIVKEMSEYICDELCRFNVERELSQEEMAVICQGCKMARFLNGILNEPSHVASSCTPHEIPWKRSFMQRFTVVN